MSHEPRRGKRGPPFHQKSATSEPHQTDKFEAGNATSRVKKVDFLGIFPNRQGLRSLRAPARLRATQVFSYGSPTMSLQLWFIKLRALGVRLSDRVRDPDATGAAQERPLRKVKIRQLEDRVLMSASPAGVEAPVNIDTADQTESFSTDSQSTATDDGSFVVATSPSDESLTDTATLEPQYESAEDVRHELVLVDTGAADYQQLVEDLVAERQDGRQIDLVLLDSSRNGIEQISETLASYDDLYAVHIVSHGSDGAVKLGSTDRLSIDDGHLSRVDARFLNGQLAEPAHRRRDEDDQLDSDRFAWIPALRNADAPGG